MGFSHTFAHTLFQTVGLLGIVYILEHQRHRTDVFLIFGERLRGGIGDIYVAHPFPVVFPHHDKRDISHIHAATHSLLTVGREKLTGIIVGKHHHLGFAGHIIVVDEASAINLYIRQLLLHWLYTLIECGHGVGAGGEICHLSRNYGGSLLHLLGMLRLQGGHIGGL